MVFFLGFFFFIFWLVFLLVSWQFISAKQYDGDQTSAMCSLTQTMPKLTLPLIIHVFLVQGCYVRL